MSPGLELEVDPLAGRQAGDEVREQLGRDGDRAVRVDLARDPVGDPDLEVGRRQLEPGVLGPEEDVGQDRERAPGRDRAADDRQAAGEVLLHDRELHERFTPGRRGWSPGAGPADDRASRLAADSGDRSGDRRWDIPLYLRTSSSSSCGGQCGRAVRRPTREPGVHGRRPPVDRDPADGGPRRDGLWASWEGTSRDSSSEARAVHGRGPGRPTDWTTTRPDLVHNGHPLFHRIGAVIHSEGGGSVPRRTSRPHRERSGPHRAASPAGRPSPQSA